MYAFIKLAYQAEWQGKKIRMSFALLLLYLTILLIVVWVLWQHGDRQQAHPGRVGHRIFTVLSLLETVVVIGVTPLFSLPTLIRDKEQHTLTLIALSPVKSATVVLGKLAWPILFTVAVIGASSIPLVGLYLSLEGITGSLLLRTHGLLIAFALSMLTLGIFCSALFDNLHAAAGIAYLAIACLAGGALMIGPLISRLPAPDHLIQAVLLVNPFIGMSSTVGFDILRTELLYAVSPLGQRRVVYPSWDTVCLCQVVASLLFLVGTVWRTAHLRQHFDRWGRFG